MRVRTNTVLVLTAILLVAALSACSQMENLRARKAFKDANTMFQSQNYREAASQYVEAIAAAPDSPDAITAHFFLGNSYDNLYQPARKGEAENRPTPRTTSRLPKFTRMPAMSTRPRR